MTSQKVGIVMLSNNHKWNNFAWDADMSGQNTDSDCVFCLCALMVTLLCLQEKSAACALSEQPTGFPGSDAGRRLTDDRR